MASLQGYVKSKGGGGNQQNGQHIDPDRQARAANAKIQMKKRPETVQQDDVHSGLPARGVTTTQNTSAAMQHAPQRRQSGPAQRHDRYDTDAESIDTTLNQFTIQVEDSQPRGPQHEQHVDLEDLGSGSGDEDEGTGDEEEDEGDDDDAELHPDDILALQQSGLGHLNPREGRAYLRDAAQRRFPTVEGDSYPSTTDGEPSQWEGAQMSPLEHFDDGGPVSPSPQRNGQRSIVLQPAHPRTFDQGRDHNMRTQSKMFHQSANIRGQLKQNPQIFPPGPQTRELGDNVLPTSQPPSYRQANRQVVPAPPVNHNYRQNNNVTFNQPQHVARQPSGPTRAPVQPPKPVEAPTPIQRPAPTHTKVVHVVQPPPIEEPPVGEFNTRADGDYDQEKLIEMSYTQLKNESFDNNPRAGDNPLADEMLEKDLVERLVFAQKNLAHDKQSDFFRFLPTGEWEDAGDWFMDQFSSIINRSKEARQKKRKLAQGFEDEIGKRHKHVAKKQYQVEDAMSKMQAQGEGLVRSPRQSKSPKPKKA